MPVFNISASGDSAALVGELLQDVAAIWVYLGSIVGACDG